MKLQRYILILASLFLVACGGGSAPEPITTAPATTAPEPNPYLWQEASPDSVNMDAAALSAAFDQAFADGTYTQAALVIKDGMLVYERYRGILASEEAALANTLPPDSQSIDSLYGRRDKDSLASSWSTAKSFVSVLVAIAIEQGFIESTEQSASDFIEEWRGDERNQVSIRNLLDMRSGLELVCLNNDTRLLERCSDDSSGTGGNLVFADNQLDACISRSLAETGVSQPWYRFGPTYEAGYWVYSNCDTMVLGEILFRATGQDLETFADVNLFSKIGMQAHWWQDNDPTGQVDGNYLAYCCLDATPRDFAKFGQLLLNNGLWDGEQVVPQSYVAAIRNITQDSVLIEQFAGSFSYGLKFWTISPQIQSDGSLFPAANSIYSTIGFDGQYIMIDFENNMLVVRNSLYHPALNRSDERKMKIDMTNLQGSNYVATLPAGTGMNTGSSYNNGALLYQVTKSINTP